MTRHSRTIVGITVWALVATGFAIGFERARQADQARATKQAAQLAEIKHLHAELNDREQALQDIRQSVDYGFVVVDSRGNVQEWNTAMERWTGIAAADKLGKQIDQLVPPQARAEYEAAFAAAMIGTEEPRCWDFKCDLANTTTGETQPVKICSRIVKPEHGGEPYAIMVVMRAETLKELGNFSRRE